MITCDADDIDDGSNNDGDNDDDKSSKGKDNIA